MAFGRHNKSEDPPSWLEQKLAKLALTVIAILVVIAVMIAFILGHRSAGKKQSSQNLQGAINDAVHGQEGKVTTITQASLEKYTREMAEGAIVMMDDSLTIPEGLDPARVISIPILQTAKEKVGKAFTANIVAVGAINRALQLFTDEQLMEGVKRHIPVGTEEINQRALAGGAALISGEQAAAFAQKIG